MKKLLKFIVLMVMMTACGTSGEIGNGNTTNVYINSSVSSQSNTVSLISDDYDIQSIETQDDGNIVIITLIRKEL